MEPKTELESFAQYWKDQKEYFKELKEREIEINKELYKNKNTTNNNERPAFRQFILLDENREMYKK